MRSAVLALLVLTVASPASAATFGELPYTPAPAGGPATCLRPTGVAGGIAQLGPLGRTSSAMDFLRISGERVARVRLGLLTDCPAVAEAGGAAVAAGPVQRPGTDAVELRAAVRDPGHRRPALVARPRPEQLPGGAHPSPPRPRPLDRVGRPVARPSRPLQADAGSRQRLNTLRRTATAVSGLSANTPSTPSL